LLIMSHLLRYTTIAGTLTWRPTARRAFVHRRPAPTPPDRAVHLRRAQIMF
jgi:hypothetical protein